MDFSPHHKELLKQCQSGRHILTVTHPVGPTSRCRICGFMVMNDPISQTFPHQFTESKSKQMKISDKDKTVLKDLIRKYDRHMVSSTVSDIDQEIWKEGKSDRDSERLKAQERYIKQKQSFQEKGQKILDQLKKGDIVQVRGVGPTRGLGLREVIRVNQNGITGHHVKRSGSLRSGVYARGSYVTNHMTDKIVKVMSSPIIIID